MMQVKYAVSAKESVLPPSLDLQAPDPQYSPMLFHVGTNQSWYCFCHSTVALFLYTFISTNCSLKVYISLKFI